MLHPTTVDSIRHGDDRCFLEWKRSVHACQSTRTWGKVLKKVSRSAEIRAADVYKIAIQKQVSIKLRQSIAFSFAARQRDRSEIIFRQAGHQQREEDLIGWTKAGERETKQIPNLLPEDCCRVLRTDLVRRAINFFIRRQLCPEAFGVRREAEIADADRVLFGLSHQDL